MTAPEGPQASEQIRREAQVWLRRLASGAATRLDVQGFQRWRAASPAHRTAFAEARRVWRALDPAIGQMLEQNPALRGQQLGASAVRPAAAVRGRRAFIGAALGTAAAAGVAAVAVNPPFGLWPSAGEWQADYRTGTGEQREVALAGRVSVAMNTQTSISRRSVGGQTVGMELIAGEAAIDLTGPGDPADSAAGRRGSTPFSVAAGAGRSLAEAARFEVRYLDSRACVTCLEGTVRVEHPSGTRSLGARQQAVYDARTLGPVQDVDPADLSAWRDGILVFRQAPLAWVVEEINRYRPGRVVLLARRLANRAVSGRFAIAKLDTVLLQIQHSYELDARTLPGGVVILS